MRRLTVDPVGLDAGQIVLLLDGDAAFRLDLNCYPAEVKGEELEHEYDIICDEVIDALKPLFKFTKGDWNHGE